MDVQNYRTPAESMRLWCAVANQMCRADGCGHWVWFKKEYAGTGKCGLAHV